MSQLFLEWVLVLMRRQEYRRAVAQGEQTQAVVAGLRQKREEEIQRLAAPDRGEGKKERVTLQVGKASETSRKCTPIAERAVTSRKEVGKASQ